MSRILVVEDEPAIAELVAINLRHAGFEVSIAADAETALKSVDRMLPDLVLLDWMLPGQSGLSLAKAWRADARTKPRRAAEPRADSPVPSPDCGAC